jgi:hypothetical protein
MPISVACPGCRITFSVPDHFAGRSGKCRHCGIPIVVPSIDDSTSPIVIDVDDDQPVNLTPVRRRKPTTLANWLGAIVVVPVVAVLISVLLLSISRPEDARMLMQGSASVGLGLGMLAIPFLPLIIPPVLARSGALSLVRWLVLALFFFVVSGLLFVMGFTMALAKEFDRVDIIAMSFRCSLMAILGCILAAAFHKPSKDSSV